MAGSLSIILEIKKWLNQQHIVVPTEWVKACVEFIQQEYNDPNLPLQNLKNYVYEQWLTADLEEIGISSLPPDLSSVQKTCLNGVFTLQLNGIRDVGKPAYSQLRQLEGTTNVDAEVSATPKPTQPVWEAKPTRMLMLNLTDGTNNVQGMEYKSISSLSIDLPPGVKVLIIGPVDCRFGLMMLTPGKIKVLGGEVERHLEKYSCKEMLKEALQIRAGEGGVEPDSEHESEVQMRSRNAINMQATVDNAPGDFFQHQPVFANNEGRHQVTRFIQNTNYSSNIQNRQPMHAENFSKDSDVTENLDIDHFESDDDDFVQNLDYNALDEIERKNSQQEPNDDDIYSGMNEDEELLREVLEFQANADSYLDQHNAININEPDPSTPSPTIESMPPIAPFTCLNSFVRKTDISQEYSITIKGFISKVLSRLECTAKNGWHLAATITDGMGSIDVNFNDQVLKQFVGLSAEDMIAIKAQAHENIEMRDKMMETIEKCKKQLQDLNCLMEVKFSPDGHVSVVKCTEMD